MMVYLQPGARISVHKEATVGQSQTVIDLQIDWSADEDHPEDGGIGTTIADGFFAGTDELRERLQFRVYREGGTGLLWYDNEWGI